MLVLVISPLTTPQRLGLSTILDMLTQAAAALLHLHNAGVVHRCISANSVVIVPSEPLVVKLGEFALAQSAVRVLELTEDALGRWCGQRRDVVGWEDGLLVRWVPPEELAPPGSPIRLAGLPAGDVYQFGGFMFEVLTGGKKPFFWVPHDVGRCGDEDGVERQSRWWLWWW